MCHYAEEPQCTWIYTCLTAETPHWLDKTVTSSDITQHKTSPVLTDTQTTCILLMRFIGK